MEERKTCPHCGGELPEAASFCPQCAQSILIRKELSPPRQLSGRTLRSVLIVLVLAALALALALWVYTRPKTYDDGSAGLVYPGRDASYYLCFSKEEPPSAVPQNRYFSELDYPYRYPVRLYVTDREGGELAAENFMQNVASLTAEISSSDAYLSVTCTEPQENSEYYPNAAAVIFVDYSIVAPGEHEAELTCTVTMRNGDVIRLHQKQQYPSISTYKYTSEDAPMDTIQDLQALVDQITASTNEADQIYLYLPPVTYEGGLVLAERSISLYGSTGSDGARTAFTGPTLASYTRGIHEFHGIDFLGGGQGVGLEVPGKARLHLTGCQVSGWETGLQARESAWINADETVFSDNTVGMHFNSSGNIMVSDDFYTNNLFRNNGTAVLLEQIPSDTSLKFPGTRFSGNGTDIDNRCGRELVLDEAVFE